VSLNEVKYYYFYWFSSLFSFLFCVLLSLFDCVQFVTTQVVPVPLFVVLDGKTSSDYVARVEPSKNGGEKMAKYLLDIIDGNVTFEPPKMTMEGR